MLKVGCLRVTHPSAASCKEAQALLYSPLDLHVLGTPPAFILSQDQTLNLSFTLFKFACDLSLTFYHFFTLFLSKFLKVFLGTFLLCMCFSYFVFKVLSVLLFRIYSVFNLLLLLFLLPISFDSKKYSIIYFFLCQLFFENFFYVRETSHGKTNIFHSMSPQHLHALRPCRLLGFVLCCKLTPLTCLMLFVFLGAELCIRLPSDSSSPRTPLPSASGWQRPAPSVDFHNLDIRHAWRTKKESRLVPLSFFFWGLL